MKYIDYYFVCSSPFAYMGHKIFLDIAARHGATIRYKPFDIYRVWENSGSVPGAKRTPARMRYRRIELQRISNFRGVPLNADPKFFPSNSELADRCIIALAEAGADPSNFMFRTIEGMWWREENIADRAQLAAYLAEAGHDAEKVLAEAGSEAVTAIRERNTDEAVGADSIGAPTYIYKGESFWGQDRLEYLDHMLKTGREAFSGLPQG